MISARNERDQRFAHLAIASKRLTSTELAAPTSNSCRAIADGRVATRSSLRPTSPPHAEVAEIVKQFGERENDLAEITSRREELLTTWRGLWGPCSIVPSMTPARCFRGVNGTKNSAHKYADLVIQLSEHEEALLNSEETATELRAALESAARPPIAICHLSSS